MKDGRAEAISMIKYLLKRDINAGIENIVNSNKVVNYVQISANGDSSNRVNIHHGTDTLEDGISEIVNMDLKNHVYYYLVKLYYIGDNGSTDFKLLDCFTVNLF